MNVAVMRMNLLMLPTPERSSIWGWWKMSEETIMNVTMALGASTGADAISLSISLPSAGPHGSPEGSPDGA